MNIHEKYISRCISLGKNGQPSTYPNPSVGCVLVHNNLIIGEGYTSAYGGAHAEVNAIASVKNKALLKEATLYSTLEPCSHFGKTPPCADLIVRSNIPKVVIGILDPHEKVAGQGIRKLRDAGCKVTVGILEKECRAHHNRFLTFHEKKRPFILLKWAETRDGFIAPAQEKRNAQPEPFWITSPPSQQRVHQWRSEEHAILVGTTTVLEDNPKLDVRHWSGKNPVRLVLDSELKIKGNYHVLDGTIPTIIFTQETDSSNYREGIEYRVIDFSAKLPQQLCNQLYKRNILSILVEGGKRTLETFIETNLWDEARIFTGSASFGKGTDAPKLSGKLVNSEFIDTDTLNTFLND